MRETCQCGLFAVGRCKECGSDTCGRHGSMNKMIVFEPNIPGAPARSLREYMDTKRESPDVWLCEGCVRSLKAKRREAEGLPPGQSFGIRSD